MNEFIVYICSESVPKGQKIDLLNKLSEYFEEKEELLNRIEELIKIPIMIFYQLFIIILFS